GLYIAGVAINALGAPILLGSFVQAWMGNLHHRRSALSDNSLQRFVSQENVMQISERVFLRGLNLLSAIAGQTLISIIGNGQNSVLVPASSNATTIAIPTVATGAAVSSLGYPVALGALFAINCLNLCMPRRPFEVASNPRNCLLQRRYRFHADTVNLQYLSLHADLSFGAQLVNALQGWRGRLAFAFNGRRLTLTQQFNFLEAFIKSLSTEEAPYLNSEQKNLSLQILSNIFGRDQDDALQNLERMAERLPAAMVSFLSYLQQQVSADRCCLSGNRVYERVIAILLKALAFREGILGVTPST
ncbi:MAG: hypothetical protein ACRC7P_07945, partial [Enterovibrio sp.]